MEGLYNKVIKGQYSKIPDRFSKDLVEIIKLMLKVIPEQRPSAGNSIKVDQLLKHPSIQKRMEFFKTYTEEMNESTQNSLLQTIRIPKNLLFLTDRLPGSNYNKNSSKRVDMNTNKTDIITIDKEKEKEMMKASKVKESKSIHQILKEHEEERLRRLKEKEQNEDKPIKESIQPVNPINNQKVNQKKSTQNEANNININRERSQEALPNIQNYIQHEQPKRSFSFT